MQILYDMLYYFAADGEETCSYPVGVVVASSKPAGMTSRVATLYSSSPWHASTKVGICWDKAFETSYDMILTPKSTTMESIGHEYRDRSRFSARLDQFLRTNPFVLSSLLGAVGISISLFVGMAWYHFIVQNAMKDSNRPGKPVNVVSYCFFAAWRCLA